MNETNEVSTPDSSNKMSTQMMSRSERVDPSYLRSHIDQRHIPNAPG